MLNIRNLLHLDEMGFTVIDSKVGYKLAECFFHHGHEMFRKEARKVFGPNTVRGHSHGIEIDPYGMTLSGMESPDHADWLQHPYVKWNCGFAVMTDVEGYSTLPHPLVLYDKKYTDFYKIREVEAPAVVPLPEIINLEYNLEWTGKEKF